MAPREYKTTPPHIRAAKYISKDPETGCWNWTSTITKPGYGRLTIARGKVVYAHRFMYEHLIGPIPEGTHTDHLCRNRRCVNPEHLEPVNPRTNCLRGVSPTAINAFKTHCPQGHEYNEKNTAYRGGRAGRECLICRNARTAKRRIDRAETQASRAAIRDLPEAA